MFGIIAKAVQYSAFFAKLTAHHVVVDEFDTSTNCARTTVVETGFPGNSECVDAAWAPKPIEQSDVSFDEVQGTVGGFRHRGEQPAAAPPAPESEMPDLARKGKI